MAEIVQVDPRLWHRVDGKHRRLLGVDDALELRRLARAGWKPDALALAYGVSKRTVYRYLDGEVREIRVGKWRALFQMARERGSVPVRIGLWESVPVGKRPNWQRRVQHSKPVDQDSRRRPIGSVRPGYHLRPTLREIR